MRTLVLLVALAFASVALASAMPTEHRLSSSGEHSIFDGARPLDVADAPPATGKVFVHQSLIDLVQRVVNTILEAALKNVALPDESLKVTGGHVDLSAIVLQNVAFNAQQVGLVAPNQVSIEFTNFSGELDLDWEYHGPLGVHDHGSATNKFSSTSISTLFTFTSDAEGRPVITLDSLEVSIDDLDIHLSGGGAWLMNFLIKLFKGVLKDVISKKITAVASTEFTNILAAIQTKYPLVLPLTGAMLNTTQVNLGLVSSTSVSATGDLVDSPAAAFLVSGSYLVVAGEWSFESTTNTTIDARQHDWIPDSLPTNPSGTAPMFGVSLDEYFLGSLLYTLTQNGKLDLYLDDAMLPPSSLIRLNTHLLATEYPALVAAYPNNNISIAITQMNDAPPLATTSPAGTSWSNAVSLMLNVIDPTQANPVVPVCNLLVNFTLDTNFNFVPNPNATGGFLLTGKISPLVFDASVVWADINPDNFAADVQGFVQTITDDVLIPIVDGILAKGIPFPVSLAPLDVTNLFLSYGNHVVSLGFDLSLPSEEARLDAAQAIVDFTEL